MSRRGRKRAVVAVGLVLGALGGGAGAGVASAATWCVGGPTGCTGTTAPTIQAALDAAAAAPGRDRVEVGWEASGAQAIAIAAGNAVDVVGVEQPVIELDATHAVSIQEPSAVVTGLDFFVIDGTAGTVFDLPAGTLASGEIMGISGQPTIRLGDATLRGVEMQYAANGSVGVEAVGPGGLIEGSAIFADHALVSTSPALVVRRSYVEGGTSATGAAAALVTAGAATFSDTILEPYRGEVGMLGLDVAPGAGTASVTLAGSTVTGAASGPLTTGVRADCTGGGTAAIHLSDTAVFGASLDLERLGPGCAVDLDHVRYGSRSGTFTDGPGVSSGPVGPFGNYSPGFGSPLIDAGGAAPAPGATDYFNKPRLVDGDADGTAVRDIGAVEYQHAAPYAEIEGPDTVQVGGDDDTTYDAYLSGDPDRGDTLSFAWTVDGVARSADASSDGYELTPTFSTAGPHTIGLTVTDPTGQHASATFAVTAQAGRAPVVTTDPPTTLFMRPPPPAEGLILGPPPKLLPVVVRLASHRLGAHKTLKVTVRCTKASTGTCRGKVVLTAGSGTGIALTRVGGATFAVARGKSKTVEVPVSSASRKLIRHHANGVPVTVLVLKSSGRRWTSGEGGKLAP